MFICYLELLEAVKEERSENTFKSGNGKVLKSIKHVTRPAATANKDIFLATKVIKNEIPVLFSKDYVKKANTYIDFANDKTIFEEVSVKFSSSGHYCITIGKVTDSNGKIVVLENTIYFSSNSSEMNILEKRKIAPKLHCQFSHPTAMKLVELLKDASIKNDELFRIMQKLIRNYLET